MNEELAELDRLTCKEAWDDHDDDDDDVISEENTSTVGVWLGALYASSFCHMPLGSVHCMLSVVLCFSSCYELLFFM
jgi:hypothetical protein